MNKMYKCPNCHQFYSMLFNLKQHFLEKHPEENVCSLLWIEPSLVRTVVANRRQQYVCKLCNKPLERDEKLTYHKKAFHAKQEKDFVCTICHQSFVNQSKLNRHDSRHDSGPEEEDDEKCSMAMPEPIVSTFAF